MQPAAMAQALTAAAEHAALHCLQSLLLLLDLLCWLYARTAETSGQHLQQQLLQQLAAVAVQLRLPAAVHSAMLQQHLEQRCSCYC
jgi:hypothetical protein